MEALWVADGTDPISRCFEALSGFEPGQVRYSIADRLRKTFGVGPETASKIALGFQQLLILERGTGVIPQWSVKVSIRSLSIQEKSGSSNSGLMGWPRH